MIQVLKFYAEWCGPCKIIKPKVDALKIKYPHITFTDVDIEQHPEMVESHQIMSVPTLVILKNGVEISRIVGTFSDEKVEQHFHN